MADNWEKVENGPLFIFDEKENRELVGVLHGVEHEVGPNNSTLYSIKTEKDGVVSMWGSTVIDIRMKNVEIGNEIKIVYLGKEKSEKRKGATYKNFEVYRKGAKKSTAKGDDESVKVSDIPF